MEVRRSKLLLNFKQLSLYYKNYFLKDLPLWLKEMVIKNTKRFEQE